MWVNNKRTPIYIKKKPSSNPFVFRFGCDCLIFVSYLFLSQQMFN